MIEVLYTGDREVVGEGRELNLARVSAGSRPLKHLEVDDKAASPF